MRTPMRVVLLAAAVATATFNAQDLSDADIQAAMMRGRKTPGKKVWEQIRKKQGVRLNRAGFDPVEKKVVFVFDRDRIALESAEATRQLRQFTIEDIKNSLPLGVMEVLLEANCYNHLYDGSLPKWGPGGGVHLVLKVGNRVIQPIQARVGRSDAISIPWFYQTTIYERVSQRTWFAFPMLSPEVSNFTVIAISGDGNRKEKELSISEQGVK